MPTPTKEFLANAHSVRKNINSAGSLGELEAIVEIRLPDKIGINSPLTPNRWENTMDSKRRDFFRNLGSKSAGIAACAVAPTMVQLASLSDEIKKLGSQFNQKLNQSAAEMTEQFALLNDRFDKAVLTMSYQQMQLYFIFLLLVISFAIDGGMTLIWTLA